MPQQVHQNTMVDCVSAYLKNWFTLVSIFEENCCNIDSVHSKVTNFGIKQNVEGLLKCLKPPSVAFDKTQGKKCTIAAAVHV